MNTDERAQRYAAVLLGGHLGDSLGGPVETWSREEIARHYGKVDRLIAATLYRNANGTIVPGDRAADNWHAQQRPGEPSDDTILTLAVARAISRSGYDLAEVAREHVAAIAACRRSDGSVDGGFGKTTLRAIEHLAAGVSPLESGVAGLGNAPAMKMAPVGLYAHVTGRYAAGMAFAALVGRMTHTDGRSIAAGVAQAHAVYALVHGVGKETLLHDVARIARETEDIEGTVAGEMVGGRLLWVMRNQHASVDEALSAIGNDGRSFSSYPFTIFMLAKHWDTPLEGLIATVNAGGDADTNAAMYGALAAARHGRFWPSPWESRLENQAACVVLGRALARFSIDGGAR